MPKQKTTRVSKNQLAFLFERTPEPLKVDSTCPEPEVDGTGVAGLPIDVRAFGLNRFDFKWAVRNGSSTAFQRHVILKLMSWAIGTLSAAKALKEVVGVLAQ